MKLSPNYGFELPGEGDFANIETINGNFLAVDAELRKNRFPMYEAAMADEPLVPGEAVENALAKAARATEQAYSHMADKPLHISSDEREFWNNKMGGEDVLTRYNTEPYTPTEAYQPTTKKYVDEAVENAVSSMRDDASLFLPPVLFAVVGVPLEIYSHQVFRTLDTDNFEVYFSSAVGRTYRRKWSYTPQELDMPAQQVHVEVRDRSGALVAACESVVLISQPESSASHSIMMIGDSLSIAGEEATLMPAVREYAKAICGEQGDVLTMVGTKGVAPNTHEAIENATIAAFMASGENNLFWDEASQRVNFAAYTDKTGVQPDIVHILLGTYSMLEPCADKKNKIDGDTEMLIDFVRTMRLDWPQTIILVGLPPYMSNQDGLGAEKFVHMSLRQSDCDKITQGFVALACQKVEEHFGKNGNVYVLPYLDVMDRDFGYGVEAAAENPYSNETCGIPASADIPAEAGQRQIAAYLASAYAYAAFRPSTSKLITNMLENPDYSDTSAWLSDVSKFEVSADGGVLTLTAKPEVEAGSVFIEQSGITLLPGHQYYVRATMQTDAAYEDAFGAYALKVNSEVVASDNFESEAPHTVSAVICGTEEEKRSTITIEMRCESGGTMPLAGFAFSFWHPVCIDLADIGELIDKVVDDDEGDEAQINVNWLDDNIPYFSSTLPVDFTLPDKNV